MVNTPAPQPVPPDVVTQTGPVVAPLGTKANAYVSPAFWNTVAFAPLNVMLLVPVRLTPWMTT